MPPGSPHDSAKASCAICDQTIDDALLTDAETGRAFHPRCVVDRLPHDAAVRAIGVLALFVVPPVIVWAG